jgi:hypothetical protein
MASLTRMPMVMIAGLVSVAALLPTAGATASQTHRSSGLLAIPFSIAAEPALEEGSTKLHLLVEQRGCGPIYERPRLAWSPGRLTVTMLARPWPRPAGEPVACPQYIAIRPLTIPLGRPLGTRTLFDGFYRPPRAAQVKAHLAGHAGAGR